MKSMIKLLVISLTVSFVAVSCKKDPGAGGKKEIKGIVTYPDGVASGAIVTIAYGTAEATETVDAQVASDGSGAYVISGLTRGDYFIDAFYTDQYGLEYNTPGYHVLIDKKNGEIKLDISLK